MAGTPGDDEETVGSRGANRESKPSVKKVLVVDGDIFVDFRKYSHDGKERG